MNAQVFALVVLLVSGVSMGLPGAKADRQIHIECGPDVTVGWALNPATWWVERVDCLTATVVPWEPAPTGGTDEEPLCLENYHPLPSVTVNLGYCVVNEANGGWHKAYGLINAVWFGELEWYVIMPSGGAAGYTTTAPFGVAWYTLNGNTPTMSASTSISTGCFYENVILNNEVPQAEEWDYCW